MRSFVSLHRFALLAALLMTAAAPPVAQPGAAAPPYPPLSGPDADAIQAVLRQYVEAVGRRDGEAAARLVTRETRAYYGRMRGMAVSAPEDEVRAAPLVDRVFILMYRHMVPAAELRALPTESAFAHTITQGWVTGAGTDEVPVGEIYGEGDRAILRADGEDLHFVREDGAWRWDMMAPIAAMGTEIAADLGSREEEDEFVLFVLRLANGRDPSPTIWQPAP